MPHLFVILLSLCFLTQAQENYHRQSKHKDEQLGAQLSPLGVLGASGYFQVGRADIIVKELTKNGIADKAGLLAEDVIIAANGKVFPEATNDINDGGKGPRESLGNAIEESLVRRDKTLRLTVERKGLKKSLKLKLPKSLPFTKTYPHKCKRSFEMLKDICDYLVKHQKPDGSWGKYVLTSTAALALLGSGNKKYSKSIQKAAYFIVDKDLAKGGLPLWNFIFPGTFLCEYYLATGDKKVLKTINYINDTLALEATSENGHHAHRITTEGGYGGGGINVITGHVYLFWTLAKKCGIKIHQKPYSAVLDHLIKCTKPTGGTGYMGTLNVKDASARTGLFTLGLHLSGDNKSLLKIQSKYLEDTHKRMREAHASGLFGMIWGSAALACSNPKGFRAHMDYWKWYMNMGETPKNHELVRYYIGSKRNNGGDGYLHWDKFNHAVIGMLLAIGNKNLFIHGNTKKGWF
ncbi:MAG: DUF6288 domain-containing protein [Lentisphaerales bacterium]|nr:DUF6288 domain-containing protein [Lentisphaerales bacterium]